MMTAAWYRCIHIVVVFDLKIAPAKFRWLVHGRSDAVISNYDSFVHGKIMHCYRGEHDENCSQDEVQLARLVIGIIIGAGEKTISSRGRQLGASSTNGKVRERLPKKACGIDTAHVPSIQLLLSHICAQLDAVMHYAAEHAEHVPVGRCQLLVHQDS